MSKRFKRKRSINLNKVIFLVILIIIFLVIKSLISKISIRQLDNNLLNTILNNSNNYNKENYASKISLYVKNSLFNNPVELLNLQLKLEKKKEQKEQVNLMYKNNELPLIYIYNSHQGEEYSYKYLEDYNIVPNVLIADSMLKDKLESIGIKTVIEEANILEYMKNNNLNHAGSYIASRVFLESAINKYPSVRLFIDLHRDAAPHNATTVNIDGKECAKILFVIGLEYDTYQNNLEIVTKINNIILEKYPSLTRGIMKKEGYGVNGVYNQDLKENVILIEIGGNENNIEEVNNTLDLVAHVIGEYINEK